MCKALRGKRVLTTCHCQILSGTPSHSPLSAACSAVSVLMRDGILPVLGPHVGRARAASQASFVYMQVWGEDAPREALSVERSLAMWELASRVQADPEVSAAAAARGGRLRQRWATRLPREPGGASATAQRSVQQATVGYMPQCGPATVIIA